MRIKVRGSGFLPERQSGGAAGADLRAAAEVILKPGERARVPTGLELEIPAGYVGLVWPRSGLAEKSGLDTLAGVIDSDYRGELGVMLINHGGEAVTIRRGDRIAQLLIQPVAAATYERADRLEPTDRGTGGFGSTG
jgi:dUTP pyrophosphatase